MTSLYKITQTIPKQTNRLCQGQGFYPLRILNIHLSVIKSQGYHPSRHFILFIVVFFERYAAYHLYINSSICTH